MSLQRTFIALVLAVIGFGGCSTGPVAVTPLPYDLTKAEALALAEQHVRANPARSSYQMSDSCYDNHDRAWIVYYKRVSPKTNETAFDHNWFAVVVRSPTQISEMME